MSPASSRHRYELTPPAQLLLLPSQAVDFLQEVRLRINALPPIHRIPVEILMHMMTRPFARMSPSPSVDGFPRPLPRRHPPVGRMSLPAGVLEFYGLSWVHVRPPRINAVLRLHSTILDSSQRSRAQAARYRELEPGLN